MDTYKVYIRIDTDNNVIAINSSAFLSDATDWVQIDEGMGDKFHHAQGHYLDKYLIDKNDCYNYRYINGMVTERSAEEKQSEILRKQYADEIVMLKSQLSETDYKIIKCSEYQLAGMDLPYDIAALHAERQVLRDRINELELRGQ